MYNNSQSHKGMKVKTNSPFLEYYFYYKHEYVRAGHSLCPFEIVKLAWKDYICEELNVKEYFEEIARGGIPKEYLKDHFSHTTSDFTESGSTLPIEYPEISCQLLDNIELNTS